MPALLWAAQLSVHDEDLLLNILKIVKNTYFTLSKTHVSLKVRILGKKVILLINTNM